MLKRLLLSTCLASAALVPLAHATPIAGQLTITGRASYDGLTVSPYGGNGNVEPGATGSFAATLASGCTACVSDQAFTYGTVGSRISEFIFSVGSGSPVFNLTELLTAESSSAHVHLTGTGVVSMLGLDPTAATWDFYEPGTGGFTETVTVGNFSPTSAPEPAGVALLATGLVALGALYRRRRLTTGATLAV